MRCEPKAVSIRIPQAHFPGSPSGLRRTFKLGKPTCLKLPGACLHIRHDEVNRSARLAVSFMLREKDRLTTPRELDESRVAGFELVFPIDGEAQSSDVKGEATLRV